MEEELTAMLGGISGGRRHWGRAPQGAALPYIILQRTGGTPVYTMKGESKLSPGRFQIDVYSKSYPEMVAITREIRTALSGFSNDEIQGIFIDAERSLPAADAGEVNPLFRTSLDIITFLGEAP